MLSFSYLIAYFFTVGVLVMGGYFLYLRKKKHYEGGVISLSDITVIVPFRNEEQRIEKLIDSILRSKNLPSHFIFVNDHSEEGGSRKIKDALQSLECTVIDLPEGVFGKKSAIRAGISLVSTRYVLTLDADVSFSDNYFSSLEQLTNANMWILPVRVLDFSFLYSIFNVDTVLANALNVGISGWKRPIMASGANLLFEKQCFMDFDSFSTHQHIQSGDDVFLLRDFTRNDLDVKISTASQFMVFTPSPKTVRQTLEQRARWAGKTRYVPDKLNLSLAFLQLIVHAVFVVLLLFYALQNVQTAFFLFLGKSIIDLVIFAPFCFATKQVRHWGLLPLYELFYPFFAFLVLIKIPKTTWKGRGRLSG